MARRFTGASSDEITTALGNLGFAFGPGTVAVIHRPASLAGSGNNFLLSVGSAWNGKYAVHVQSGVLMLRMGATSRWGTGTTGVGTGEWYMHAVSKDTGTLTPRFHRYRYSTDNHTHEVGSGTLADSPVPTTKADIGFLNVSGETVGQYYDGDIAIMAVWNVVLTDAEVEALAFDMKAWFQAPPKALWVFDQATTSMLLRDMTGGGANETSKSGTSVSANSVPLWTPGGDVIVAQATPAVVTAEPDIALHLEAAFGSNPTDASYTWTDISDYGRNLSYSRGRQNELNRVETGTAAALLKDKVSDFDPRNPAGAYSAHVRPMVPIRAYMRITGTDYPLCLQYASRWPRTRRETDAYTERSLSMNDGFAWLARAGLAGQSFPEQTSGARFAAVLDAVGWPSALRDLDTGNTTVAAVSYGPDDSTKALDHLLAVAETELGFPYINASGQLRFVERHALLKDPYGTSQATFRDAGGSSGTAYQDLVPSYDEDQIVNEFIGSREGGTAQTASDSASDTTYGTRTETFISLATSDVEVLAQAQWRLRQFKEPLDRVESITIMPGTDLAVWATILALEPGMRITVMETPPGFATEQSTDYTIQKLSVKIDPGPYLQTRFTFQLWPALAATPWIILDDPSQSQLGVNVLAY